MSQAIWLGLAALAVAGACALAYVLYNELRYQHHIWHDPCVTPLQTRQDIGAVLAVFREVLDGKGITWWLDYGTLLGAWRLGRVMAFDHDLDLSYLGEHQALMRQCLPELATHGVELNLENTSIHYRGRKIGDAETWWRYGDRLCRDDPGRRRGIVKYWRAMFDDMPASAVDPVWSIRFNGEMYPCPSHPERHLRQRYMTCRLHLRLVMPHKQKCWMSSDFWSEAARIWKCRDAPMVARPVPAARSGGAT